MSYRSVLQLSLGKLRKKPATRRFDGSFAPNPGCDERFARQQRDEPPPEFIPASFSLGLVHYLSGPTARALARIPFQSIGERRSLIRSARVTIGDVFDFAFSFRSSWAHAAHARNPEYTKTGGVCGNTGQLARTVDSSVRVTRRAKNFLHRRFWREPGPHTMYCLALEKRVPLSLPLVRCLPQTLAHAARGRFTHPYLRHLIVCTARSPRFGSGLRTRAKNGDVVKSERARPVEKIAERDTRGI